MKSDDKIVDELTNILMGGAEGRTLLGIKGLDSSDKAEELSQWLYEHLQANGLESISVTFKSWSSKNDQHWVEAILEFGDQVYSVSTLTNMDKQVWQLQVRNKWATHVTGSLTDLEIERIQLELNPCTTIESITKKLIHISKTHKQQ